jgi:hypothetical protein
LFNNEHESVFPCASHLPVGQNSFAQIHLQDKKLFLVSSRDQDVAKKTLLGGFGQGKYQPYSDTAHGVKYELVNRDRTTCQLESLDRNASEHLLALDHRLSGDHRFLFT